MSERKVAGVLPYLCAIGIVAAAVGVRMLANPILQNRQPFAVFVVAVIVAARYCGFKPALLVVLLSALASRYFFIQPRGSFVLPGSVELGSLCFFIVIGLYITFLMRSERRAVEKLEVELAQRKQVEAELRVSHDRFQSFIDDGPFVAFIKDEKGRYVYINKLSQTSLQRDTASWLGQNDYELFSKELADSYVGNDRLALEKNQSVHFDETSTLPDGSVQHWSTVKFPLHDADGRRYLGGVSIEVTAARTAQQRARESEATLLLALEAGRLGIWSWDLSTNRVQSSATNAVIQGRSPDETDTSVEDFGKILPEDRELVREVIARAMRNEAPERVTYRVIWPDGSVHWVEAVGRVFCDASGMPRQVMGVCADITERKNAEEVLRESEDRFRAFMDHSPAPAWAKDEQGRYVYVNKVFEEFAGIRPGEWLGKTDFDIWPHDKAQHFWNKDQIVLTTGESLRLTEESLFAQQLEHFFYKTKFLFQDRHQNRFVGGVSVDVTEAKLTEQALRAKEALLLNLINVQEEEKQFLCREFHDGLIQYAVGSLMALEAFQIAQPTESATIGAVIENLRKGIDDGRRVIRGVRPAVLDDSGLEAAIEDLVDQFSTTGMMVTCKCETEIGRLTESIQTTVYRVVQESLNNAQKHSGTDVVRIELKKAASDLFLEIRDFGCGFEVEPARKRGFGLVGMSERVRLHGGECRIESALDEGTHIFVRLPVTPMDMEN